MAENSSDDKQADSEFFDTQENQTPPQTQEPPSDACRQINISSCVEQLTDGLVDLYVPQLHLFEYTLNELVSDQEGLISGLERELQSAGCEELRYQLQETLERVPQYQQKVAGLEREMRAIRGKCSKLGKRAERLSDQRERKELERLEHKRREMEREKQLEAKRVTPQHTV